MYKTIINPHDLSNINSNSDRETIEMFFLCCVFVAGKKADVMFPKTHKFIYEQLGHINDFPFNKIKLINKNGNLREELEKNKFGQYDRLVKLFSSKNFTNLSYEDLFNENKVNTDYLESMPGIGPKTSRFILSYTQDPDKYAILDTHILKYIDSYAKNNSINLNYKIPNSTPPKNSYKKIEKIYLDIARRKGMTAKDLDFAVWDAYSTGKSLPI